MTAKSDAATGLALLRTPFAPNQISKLPKGNVMLDYVGHAALTDRLLDADPLWDWEPMALDARGFPAIDEIGGLWIKLTVCGKTRLGYGHAGMKKGGDAVKELIGDALRNAAMRFGAALDLWHKGDLHLDAEEDAAGEQSNGSQSVPGGNAAPPRTNWGGRYPNKTAMRAARVTHHAELERLAIEGAFGDLEDYLTSPEYADYVKIATEQFPDWLEGELPEGAPPEYIHTFVLEQKARDMIALRGNRAGEE